MNIGERLSELRKDRKLKQKEISKKLNVAISTVSNYETGSHQPDLASLCRLADLYDVSTDYLLGRTDIKIDIKSLDEPIGSSITKATLLRLMEHFSKEDQEYLVNTVRLLYYRYQRKDETKTETKKK